MLALLFIPKKYVGSDWLFSVLVPVSCLAALSGDFFMLNPNKPKSAIAGGLSFAIEHILNLVMIVFLLSAHGVALPWYVYLIIPCALILLALIGGKILNDKSKGFAVAYFGIHLTLLIFAIVLTIKGAPKDYTLSFALIGYVLFIISDTILAVSIIKGHEKRPDFYVMLTYLTAQLFIYLTFCQF